MFQSPFFLLSSTVFLTGSSLLLGISGVRSSNGVSESETRVFVRRRVKKNAEVQDSGPEVEPNVDAKVRASPFSFRLPSSKCFYFSFR